MKILKFLSRNFNLKARNSKISEQKSNLKRSFDRETLSLWYDVTKC